MIIAILTFKEKKRLPTHININSGEHNLAKQSTILLEQIQTIDKSRLKKYIGSVSSEKMNAVNKAMMISLGLWMNIKSIFC